MLFSITIPHKLSPIPSVLAILDTMWLWINELRVKTHNQKVSRSNQKSPLWSWAYICQTVLRFDEVKGTLKSSASTPEGNITSCSNFSAWLCAAWGPYGIGNISFWYYATSAHHQTQNWSQLIHSIYANSINSPQIQPKSRLTSKPFRDIFVVYH